MEYNQVSEWQKGKMVTLSTHLAKPSPFYFGCDIEDHFLATLANYECDRLFFFTEPHLFEWYGKTLYEKISQQVPGELEFVPAGEKCKYFSVLEETCEKLIAKGASKKSILIAFGGGVVGNLVGLVAGLIYRGIRYIEIPTTGLSIIN